MATRKIKVIKVGEKRPAKPSLEVPGILPEANFSYTL